MNTILKQAVMAALIAASTGALALQAPTQSKNDPRIKYVNYRANDVVPINAAPGRISVITFAPGETVVNYGSGFISAWDFATQDNHFYLKPKEANGSTNLFVVTSKNRTYMFDLRYRKQVIDMTYQMAFRYPAEERKQRLEQAKRDEIKKRLLEDSIDSSVPSPREVLAGEQISPEASQNILGGKYNWNYTMNFGKDPASMDIAPEAVYDDGLFTVIRFRPGADMPTVFQVTGKDPREDETILKTHIDPKTGALVVEKVVREMRLRARNAVVGIYNESYGRLVKDPFRHGTSVPGIRRTFASGASEPEDEQLHPVSERTSERRLRSRNTYDRDRVKRNYEFESERLEREEESSVRQAQKHEIDTAAERKNEQIRVTAIPVPVDAAEKPKQAVPAVKKNSAQKPAAKPAAERQAPAASKAKTKTPAAKAGKSKPSSGRSSVKPQTQMKSAAQKTSSTEKKSGAAKPQQPTAVAPAAPAAPAAKQTEGSGAAPKAAEPEQVKSEPKAGESQPPVLGKAKPEDDPMRALQQARQALAEAADKASAKVSLEVDKAVERMRQVPVTAAPAP